MPTNPDTFESAYDVNDPNVNEFPVDTSTAGKHYEIAVPDYIPGRTPTASPPHDVTYLNSYLHLGVPHAGAGDTSQVALGEDLLANVTYPDGFDLKYGGIRDHTDGNRIITTRQDRIEVVRGQSRTIIRADQDWQEEDDDWKPPSTSDGEASVEDHIYPSLYYEVISTSYQPGTGGAPMYGEARQKYADIDKYKVGADTVEADFYEYVNADNLVEVYAGATTLVEKIYGGRLLEVISTVHADKADWEEVGMYDKLGGSLKAGNLVEYMFANDLTEVIRAKDLLVDKIYGDRLIEVISTWGINDMSKEKDPTTLVSGDLYEYMNAANDLVEIMRAQNTFREEIYGKNIIEYIVADLNLVEHMEAMGSVDELTAAIGGINALTIAGGELMEVNVGGVLHMDVLAAVGMFCEVMAGLINVEVGVGLLNAEISIGPEKHEIDFGDIKKFFLDKLDLCAFVIRYYAGTEDFGGFYNANHGVNNQMAGLHVLN